MAVKKIWVLVVNPSETLTSTQPVDCVTYPLHIETNSHDTRDLRALKEVTAILTRWALSELAHSTVD